MNLLDFWVGFTGAMAPSALPKIPEGWLAADGSDVSRVDNVNLFKALRVDFTGNTTNGSGDITNVSPSPASLGIANGHELQIPGIAGVATVTGVSGTTVTVGTNATVTAAAVAGYAAKYGLGDGATTFGLPDMAGEITVGRYLIKG